MGSSSLLFTRVQETVSGECDLVVSNLVGLYQILCSGFNGKGGPLSFSIALAFNSSENDIGKILLPWSGPDIYFILHFRKLAVNLLTDVDAFLKCRKCQ